MAAAGAEVTADSMAGVGEATAVSMEAMEDSTAVFMDSTAILMGVFLWPLLSLALGPVSLPAIG